MGEQRFEVRLMASVMNGPFKVIIDNDSGVSFEAEEAVRRLNQQAETIEVLREWIRRLGYEATADAKYWAEVDLSRQWNESDRRRIELAKRRIAALEGK